MDANETGKEEGRERRIAWVATLGWKKRMIFVYTFACVLVCNSTF